MCQGVYEGEDEFLAMQRSLDDLFRVERGPVNVMLGEVEGSWDRYLE